LIAVRSKPRRQDEKYFFEIPLLHFTRTNSSTRTPLTKAASRRAPSRKRNAKMRRSEALRICNRRSAKSVTHERHLWHRDPWPMDTVHRSEH